VLAGGPLGFLPEAAGEGVRIGVHGAGQGAVAGFDAEVAGEVVLVPGAGADRGLLDHVEDGGVAVLDAAQHPLVGVLGTVAVEDPARGCLAGVAAEFLRGGDNRRRDLGQAPARAQDQQVAGPVAVRVEESTANRRPVTGEYWRRALIRIVLYSLLVPSDSVGQMAQCFGDDAADSASDGGGRADGRVVGG